MAEFYLSEYACKRALGESSVEVICSQERWFISSERAEYWGKCHLQAG